MGLVPPGRRLVDIIRAGRGLFDYGKILVLAVGMHGKRLVNYFSDYHGNSSFALQLPPSKPPPVICSENESCACNHAVSMVRHSACMIWHSILCNHTQKYKHVRLYICLELYMADLQQSYEEACVKLASGPRYAVEMANVTPRLFGNHTQGVFRNRKLTPVFGMDSTNALHFGCFSDALLATHLWHFPA